MSIIESLILGLIQGLTEFLPVSSSGHLAICHSIFGIEGESSLLFDVVLHGATVLSTIVVFWKEIIDLFKGLFTFKWNESNKYLTMLLISAIPAGVAGVLFNDQIETLFTGNLLFIGFMLLITATLLAIANFAKKGTRKIGFWDSLIIGVAQMMALIPGISRSGSTIATGMIIGNDKSQLAKFSFLMVIVPIIGANFLQILGADFSSESSTPIMPLIIGAVTAFISGLVACKWMVNIVRKGKMIYFAIYCLAVGLISIIAA